MQGTVVANYYVFLFGYYWNTVVSTTVWKKTPTVLSWFPIARLDLLAQTYSFC